MNFERFPQEIVLEIISHMSAHDLTRAGSNPGPGTPEKLDSEDESKDEEFLLKYSHLLGGSPSLDDSSSVYPFRPRIDRGDSDSEDERFERFKCKVKVIRLKDLALRVSNLEYLELHGGHQWCGWDYMHLNSESTLCEQFDLPRAGWSNLRRVKLYGYIPRSFAA
ncbi:hypothetical protein F53441_8505 [Fusarium austroafricanum]|uniref:F-box domain-containing protein n=1 Tax=Fusarium austroafricanum TaxID=2364996 RepID=A0A8H4KB77_9HYPO|nr:hypothetical protein F53441_8505 [Fusarium austroafricanum]